MYSQRIRIFGPKSPRPYLIGAPIQRGSGFGSFLAGLAKKFLPVASRGVKNLLKSDLVKDVGNTLLQQGVNAATDVASNLIEGKENPFDGAKDRLQNARKDIANSIRKRNFFNTETIVTPKKKRKRRQVKSKKRKK